MINKMDIPSEYLTALGHITPLRLPFSSGPIGFLVWTLLLPVLVTGIVSAVRRRPGYAYWALAHIHFLLFFYFVIYLVPFLPCACLTPWLHIPDQLAHATVALSTELILLALVGGVIALRCRRFVRFSLLPLLSTSTLLLDGVIMWVGRLEMLR
jgi:hypothetical protein